MTTPPTPPTPQSDSAVPKPTEPVYAQSELYDSPADLARWPLLAPLLKTWQTEVWEKDHSEFRGSWHYDQEAIRLQERHRWAVILAAITGTAAVVLAILQLGKVMKAAEIPLMILEVTCLMAAVVTIVLGLFLSLDHRWRGDRFKAEQYRMLKFHFLHDAARWLAAGEEKRGRHLVTYISRIHAADRHVIKEWIHWKKEILPVLETPAAKLDANLAGELVDYFRERRLIPQQHYFHSRGQKLHRVESIVRWVGPGLFFASVICALTHAALHVLEPKSHTNAVFQKALQEPAKETANSAGENPGDASIHSKFKAGNEEFSWAIALALAAAILPVTAAGIRTWRGAFEFGRNSLRFESMAHQLELLLDELDKAKSPEAKLAILRRGEYAMESEHRAWMRLMMEAEWFG